MGNCLLNAGLTLLCLLPVCCTPVHHCFFPYSKRSDNSLSRTWGPLWHKQASASLAEDGKTGGKKKRKPAGRKGWWKIKPMLARLPVAREVSLSFSEAWWMEDKGWAKEMLCLSLHGLLIYLCPILGNPCSRRLGAKASNQAVCPKRIHYFR